MASKSLFGSTALRKIPKTDSFNHEGGRAYSYSDKHKLAQLASTGCLNGTFYANAQDQLDTVFDLSMQVDPEFLAKTAIHARKKGYMKDMPALMLAVLSQRDSVLFRRAFPQVIDNGKMLRNFVQIIRSGVTGRKSLGTAPKQMVANWLATAPDYAILHGSVGQDPSLGDVIKLAHPKAKTPERNALLAWCASRPWDPERLPENLRQFEAWKRDRSLPLPDVPFQMLTSASGLTAQDWEKFARRGGWHMVRMNLNSFARHGVFEMKHMPKLVAKRLADREAVRKAKVMPWQLLMAFKHADRKVPGEVLDALQQAMEYAVENVPKIPGNVVLCPDVSWSMSWPVTGSRPGATSKARCVDAAALMTAALLRRNPEARVLPFSTIVQKVPLNPRGTVMENAAKLAQACGGGTACAAPLEQLVREKAKIDLLIMFSDNESWADMRWNQGRRAFDPTPTAEAWAALKKRNPEAKMVCLDIQPSIDSQAPDAGDVMNIGGFSDQIFPVIADFARHGHLAGHWVKQIDAVEI